MTGCGILEMNVNHQNIKKIKAQGTLNKGRPFCRPNPCPAGFPEY